MTAALLHDATVAVYRAAHQRQHDFAARESLYQAADALDAARRPDLAEEARAAVFNPAAVDGLLRELWEMRG